MVKEKTVEPKIKIAETHNWTVQRYAKIAEVWEVNGDIKFNVLVWDEGREALPFINKWFSNEVQAQKFLQRVMAGEPVLIRERVRE